MSRRYDTVIDISRDQEQQYRDNGYALAHLYTGIILYNQRAHTVMLKRPRHISRSLILYTDCTLMHVNTER